MQALKRPGIILGTIALIVVAGIMLVNAGSPTPRIRANQVLDAAGHPLFIVGVARPGLEYSCTGVGPYDVASFALMRLWNVNTVRLSISSTFWIDRDGSCPTYHTTLSHAIANAEAAGLSVIIDMHRSVDGHGQMPDGDVLTFWQQFLPQYRNDHHLMVELFNEPHDVSWTVWHDGGTVDSASDHYQAVGMQQLVATANSLAPSLPVIVSGLSWEYDYSGMQGHDVLHGQNLIYGVHIYNYAGKQPQDWYHAFGFLAQRHPVLITEFGDTNGCNGDWLRTIMPQLRTQSAGMVAWAWITDSDPCHYPALLADWIGNPSTYGQSIRDYFVQTFMPH